MISLTDCDDPPLGTLTRLKAIQADVLSKLASCKNCGGTGQNLVFSESGTCAHCRCSSQQSTKLKGYEGFFDITPRLDGGVLKMFSSFNMKEEADRDEAARAACGGQLVPEGRSPTHWQYTLTTGCPCGVHFIARFPSSEGIGKGEVVGSSRDIVDGKHVGGTDDPVDVMMGRGDIISGVELALLSMSVGERSLFLIRNEYAWGSVGDGFRVGPNVKYIEYDLELVFCLAPLPLMPRGAEADRKREERQRKERQTYRDGVGPLMTRLLDCNSDRLAGNALFTCGDFENAKKLYDAGFLDLLVTKDEWEGCEGEPGLTSEMKREVNKAKALLHLNRSLVNLKLNRLDAAKWDADRSIDHHKASNVMNKSQIEDDEDDSFCDMFICKGLFRKGQAIVGLVQQEIKKGKKRILGYFSSSEDG